MHRTIVPDHITLGGAVVGTFSNVHFREYNVHFLLFYLEGQCDRCIAQRHVVHTGNGLNKTGAARLVGTGFRG